MLRFALFAAIVILSVAYNAYPTEVSGDVWGEWTAAGNPYNVVGDLRVPPGSSLVIGPGCYVEFQGQYHFIVDTISTLQVNGVDSDSVTFTAADTTSGWGGIRLLSADSSFIRYSIIKYGGVENDVGHGEIYCYNSHLKVENCLFLSNWALSGETINIYRYSTYEIRCNIFSDSSPRSETAINVFYHSEGVIEENIFEGYHNGSVLQIGGNCLIRQNTFRNNNNCTVILLDAGPILIEENIIFDNVGLIFWLFLAGHTTTIQRNIVYGNYCPWASAGGIINCTDSYLYFLNNTISNNHGGDQTYIGAFHEEFSGQPAILINNIIWGNDYQPDYIFFVGYGANLTTSYSDIQGGWSGIGNIMADPLFVDTANGDFYLMPGSPCIDTGDPASPLDPDSTRADMGALYFDQTTGINFPPTLPREITLYQNYPNPFNAGTKISFTIHDQYDVTINIFDMLGRRVRSLVDGQIQAGKYSINWDGRSDTGERMSSGVYFYNLKADMFEDSKKMVILK